MPLALIEQPTVDLAQCPFVGAIAVFSEAAQLAFEQLQLRVVVISLRVCAVARFGVPL